MTAPWPYFAQPLDAGSDYIDSPLDGFPSNAFANPVDKLKSALLFRRYATDAGITAPDFDPTVLTVADAAQRAGWQAPLLPANYVSPASAIASTPDDQANTAGRPAP